MPYATGTITNSATPAKDLMAAVGTQLSAAGMVLTESYATALATQVWPAVAYGNGTFVALCQATGTAATSPDGVTWTQRSTPASAGWMSVAYGAGLFVAVSTNPMTATSPDGITWTMRAMPSNVTWTSVYYGGGQFIALTNGANCATSPDGIVWTLRAMPSSTYWASVAYGNGTYVAVSQTQNPAAISVDGGITWKALAGLPAASSSWSSVVFAAGLFVAVANGSAVAGSSPDGVTWTQRALPSSGSWSSVAYGGGMFAAVSGSGTAASSPDGMTWTGRGTAAAAWTSVAYGGGVFAAVAQNAAAVAQSSPDAITWTPRTLTPATSNATADVWRSPAAANQFGQDWYLILGRSTDYATAMTYQVAEQYSVATHRATNYGGTAAAVAPAATTYANPAGAAAPTNVAAGNAQVTALSSSQPTTYFISATANRVVVGLRTTAESGFYAGLYDDLLPAGTTQFPLVCAALPVSQGVNTAIGGNNSTAATGGFTREPLQGVAVAANFEARIHNGSWMQTVSTVVQVPGGFTPCSSYANPYGNTNSVARVMIGSARSTTQLGDALRGLLIGCVACQLPSVAGDVVTSGGKTYVRFAGPAAAYGVFVDQGA